MIFFEVAKNLQALPELKKKLERKEKAEKKAEEKRNATRIAQRKIDLLEWRMGKKKYVDSYGFEGEPVYLRAVTYKQGEIQHEIQTSKGARVKYESGKLLYKLIQAGKDIKGHDIDGYTVISLNGVLKVGCHEITRKEIDRFARKEGWTK